MLWLYENTIATHVAGLFTLLHLVDCVTTQIWHKFCPHPSCVKQLFYWTVLSSNDTWVYPTPLTRIRCLINSSPLFKSTFLLWQKMIKFLIQHGIQINRFEAEIFYKQVFGALSHLLSKYWYLFKDMWKTNSILLFFLFRFLPLWSFFPILMSIFLSHFLMWKIQQRDLKYKLVWLATLLWCRLLRFQIFSKWNLKLLFFYGVRSVKSWKKKWY